MLNFESIAILSLIIAFFAHGGYATTYPCKFRSIGDGVCVCDANYCDTVDTVEPKCGSYSLTTTTKSGKRFDSTTGKINNSNRQFESLPEQFLRINQSNTHQQFIGFGGALTDASSKHINLMVEPLRQCIYQSYMSPHYGTGYRMLRIPLGASDFSEGPYAYNETPVNDTKLINMTELFATDRLHIKQINEMKMYRPEGDIHIMLCAWSPPPWMKTNNDWSGFATLKREYYDTWALYQAKGIELWQKANVPIWAISTGNEPYISFISQFVSLQWTPENQAYWVRHHLRPALNKQGLSNVKIVGIDDQRPFLQNYVKSYIKSNSEIDIIGVHWYFDSFAEPSILDKVSKNFKRPILNTEACEGYGLDPEEPFGGGLHPKIGSWIRCQSYVKRIMVQLQHSVVGFIDWNLVLDQEGGPNYAKNFVDAPIIFFKENQTFFKQPSYYGIAHFSSFIQPGCVRVDSKVVSSSDFVQGVTFSCGDNKIVVVLQNTNSIAERILVIDESNEQVELNLDANSVNTLVLRIC